MILASSIVSAIIADLRDRRGLRKEWANIDEEVKQEIVQTWVKITNDVILETLKAIDRKL